MATNQLTVYGGSLPDKANNTPLDFANNVFAYQTWINSTFVPEFNSRVTSLNTDIETVNGYMTTTQGYMDLALQHKNDAENYKDTALASANYRGDWRDDYAGGYGTGQGVTYEDGLYRSKVDNNTATPTKDNTDDSWCFLGRLSKRIDVFDTHTVSPNEQIKVYAANGSYTILAPETHAEDDEFYIDTRDIETNNVLLDGNGSDFVYVSKSDSNINLNRDGLILKFVSDGTDWRVFI